MYLHLGGKHIILLKDIVAIIKVIGYNSCINEELIEIGKLEKKVVNLYKNNEPKSCVITKDKIYLSSVTAATLTKRI